MSNSEYSWVTLEEASIDVVEGAQTSLNSHSTEAAHTPGGIPGLSDATWAGDELALQPAPRAASAMAASPPALGSPTSPNPANVAQLRNALEEKQFELLELQSQHLRTVSALRSSVEDREQAIAGLREHIVELTAQRDVAEARASRAAAEGADERSSLEAEVRRLRLELRDAREEQRRDSLVRHLSSTIRDVEANAEGLKRDLRVSRAETAAAVEGRVLLESRLQERESEIAGIRARLGEQASRVQALQAQLSGLVQRDAGDAARADAAEAALTRAKGEVKKRVQQIQDLTGAVRELAVRENEALSRVAELEEEGDRLRGELQREGQARERAEAEGQESARQLQAALLSLEQAQGELARLRNERAGEEEAVDAALASARAVRSLREACEIAREENERLCAEVAEARSEGQREAGRWRRLAEERAAVIAGLQADLAAGSAGTGGGSTTAVAVAGQGVSFAQYGADTLEDASTQGGADGFRQGKGITPGARSQTVLSAGLDIAPKAGIEGRSAVGAPSSHASPRPLDIAQLLDWGSDTQGSHVRGGGGGTAAGADAEAAPRFTGGTSDRGMGDVGSRQQRGRLLSLSQFEQAEQLSVALSAQGQDWEQQQGQEQGQGQQVDSTVLSGHQQAPAPPSSSSSSLSPPIPHQQSEATVRRQCEALARRLDASERRCSDLQEELSSVTEQNSHLRQLIEEAHEQARLREAEGRTVPGLQEAIDLAHRFDRSSRGYHHDSTAWEEGVGRGRGSAPTPSPAAARTGSACIRDPLKRAIAGLDGTEGGLPPDPSPEVVGSQEEGPAPLSADLTPSLAAVGSLIRERFAHLTHRLLSLLRPLCAYICSCEQAVRGAVALTEACSGLVQAVQVCQERQQSIHGNGSSCGSMVRYAGAKPHHSHGSPTGRSPLPNRSPPTGIVAALSPPSSRSQREGGIKGGRWAWPDGSPSSHLPHSPHSHAGTGQGDFHSRHGGGSHHASISELCRPAAELLLFQPLSSPFDQPAVQEIRGGHSQMRTDWDAMCSPGKHTSAALFTLPQLHRSVGGTGIGNVISAAPADSSSSSADKLQRRPSPRPLPDSHSAEMLTASHASVPLPVSSRTHPPFPLHPIDGSRTHPPFPLHPIHGSRTHPPFPLHPIDGSRPHPPFPLHPVDGSRTHPPFPLHPVDGLQASSESALVCTIAPLLDSGIEGCLAAVQGSVTEWLPDLLFDCGAVIQLMQRTEGIARQTEGGLREAAALHLDHGVGPGGGGQGACVTQ